MPDTLPKSIADYFAAPEGADLTAFFTADAVVHDEHEAHVGPEAIRAWRAKVEARYHPVSVPIAHRMDGERLHVTARVSGSFPGSPIELDYAFTLNDGLIASLAIS